MNDIESIKILLDGVTNNRVKNLFKNYIVENPKIHLEGGTYNNSIRITLSAKMGTSIYYTIDGSNPEKKGVLYSNAIVLDKKGTYTLKVVAKNEKGMFSDIVSEKYIIRIEAPDDPIISNTKTNEIIEGGTFTEETYLTIHVPSGCNAYFTWDNTDPDKESGTLYTEPVMVPEGDNILSVIIIDEENEQESIIFRGRSEYYPEEGFCVLSIYMEESKTHSWIWSDLTNEIECNYIHYQDDHYVVSYKANEDYVGFCQSAIMLSPVEDTHDHTKDSITEYNSYIIEITVAEDGNHVFNVYPATVSDEYVTELDDEVSTEEYSTESTTE